MASSGFEGANPFLSDNMVARGFMMSATDARQKETTLQSGFNEMDNESAGENMDEIEEQAMAMAQKFTVNMEVSFREFHAHIIDSNRDFKENVIKKIHTVKLND